MIQQHHVVTTQPMVVQQTSSPLKIKTQVILALGITQIVIGAVTFLLGIGVVAALSHFWVNNSGTAIVAGIWLIVTGIIGVSSAKHPNNGCLNGTNMGFNIIACIGAFLDGCFFSAAISHYNVCNNDWKYYYSPYSTWYGGVYCVNELNTARGLYGSLLFLMIAEFFIALIISIYCCQANSCCGGSNRSQGVIVQTQQQPAVVYSSGPTVMTTTSYPSNGQNQQQVFYPPPPQHQQQPQQQGYSYPPQQGGGMDPTKEPPPMYNQQQQQPNYNSQPPPTYQSNINNVPPAYN